MKTQYDTILLDLDDTSIVTLPEYKNLVIGNTLGKFGIVTTFENIDSIWQGRMRDEILRSLKVDPVEFWAEFDKQDMPEIRMRYLVAQRDFKAIHDLAKQGYDIGFVTGSPEKIIPSKLIALGMEKVPYVSTFDTEGIREKPNPWGIKECMDILDTGPERTMYIGNSTADISAAKGAGVLDVYVERDVNYRLRTEPTVKMKTLFELIDILNR